MQVEKGIERGLAAAPRLAGMGLVGRAVGIDDEVQCGAGDFEIAEQNVGLQIPSRLKRTRRRSTLRVGRLAGRFDAVNDQAAGFGLKIEQIPVEGGHLNPAAGGLFELGDRGACGPGSRMRGTHPEIEADGGEQRAGPPDAASASGTMAQEEAAQAAAAAARAARG